MTLNTFFMIAGIWAVFGFQHSLLAQASFKTWIGRALGPAFQNRAYRILYFVSQCWAFPFAWYLLSSLESGPVLWSLPPSFHFLSFTIRVIGHLLIVLTFLNSDVASFVGVRQLWGGASSQSSLGQDQLVTSFPFSLVRHPMYLGIFLSLLGNVVHFTPKAILNLLCLLAYIEIGAFFEERQLTRQFGESYHNYVKHVPKLFPKLM